MNSTSNSIPAAAKSVVFDLETSGFSRNCEIVQIAARYKDSRYNAYIMPLCGIQRRASAINGLEVKGGKLILNSLPVLTVSPRVAIDGLLKFLRSVAQSIILTSHGGFNSDAALIIKLVREQGRLQQFMSVVYGFADTLPMLQNKLTDRPDSKRQRSQRSFKLPALAKEYLGPEAAKGAASHNALCGTEILQNLLAHPDINITNNQILENAKPIEFLITEQ